MDEKVCWKKKHMDKSLGHDNTEEWLFFFQKGRLPCPSTAMLEGQRRCFGMAASIPAAVIAPACEQSLSWGLHAYLWKQG